jgi:hypothetical protein
MPRSLTPGVGQYYQHTTDDEIAFIRGLERRGLRTQLRLYRRSLPNRSWDGDGMTVDKSKIEAELARILGKESAEERKESYESLVTRVAVEWLGGGRLRRVTQQRALADQRKI